jgi:hypothetical protein
MANNDSALYTLRYNEISKAIEAAIGGNWTALSLTNLDGITQLTGDVTAGPGSGSQAASIASTVVTGKLLTGYSSGAGTVAATDTILQAFNKLNGNDALKLPLAGGTLTGNLLLSSAYVNAGTFITSPSANSLNATTVNTGSLGIFDGSGNITGIIGHTPGSVATALTVDLGQNSTDFKVGDLTAHLTVPALTVYSSHSNNVGIFNATPDATAALDIQALNPTTAKYTGFLPPRMTTTQRNGITSPAEGLIVYDTSLHQLWQYQNSSWAEVGGGGGASFTPTALTSTTSSFTTTSTSFVNTNLSASFTMADASHRVKVTAYGSGYTSSATNTEAHYTLAMDGMTVGGAGGLAEITQNVGVSYNTCPIAMSWIFSPADTSAHTFAVYMLETGGVSAAFGVAQTQVIVIEEII